MVVEDKLRISETGFGGMMEIPNANIGSDETLRGEELCRNFCEELKIKFDLLDEFSLEVQQQQLDSDNAMEQLISELVKESKRIRLTIEKRVLLAEYLLTKEHVIGSIFEQRTWRKHLEDAIDPDIVKVIWHPIFVIVHFAQIKEQLLEKGKGATKDIITKIVQKMHDKNHSEADEILGKIGKMKTAAGVSAHVSKVFTFMSRGNGKHDEQNILIEYPFIDAQEFLREMDTRPSRGIIAITSELQKYFEKKKLAVDPETCTIPVVGGSSSHKLTNLEGLQLFFKIKSPDSTRLTINPSSGFIDSFGSTNIIITRTPEEDIEIVEPNEENVVIYFAPTSADAIHNFQPAGSITIQVLTDPKT
ncbi:unnamed protein product [Caenorhabditis angaria]|uniref:Major sperm protein n=1 Tax=Caenorhabditis angaria TaxID=860376 RepID=A0A9P1IEF2_9PELO|nr:unnamed protein product [Caenorhabditis angaria]CAI5444244.1 unnamed protein product [Caenorhabditis angaria]